MPAQALLHQPVCRPRVDLYRNATGHLSHQGGVRFGGRCCFQANVGASLADQAARLDHDRENALHLALAAARKESEETCVARDTRLFGSECFQKGMSNKYRVEPACLIHGLLERKDADHQVEKAGHFWNSPAVPSPNLRADIEEDLPGKAARSQGLGQAEIESGIVDQNDGARFRLLDLLEHAVELLPEVAVMLQDIPQPQHPGLCDPIVKRLGGKLSHLGSSGAEKTSSWFDRAQSPHYLGGAGVPAGFAGNEPEARHRG